jgi:MFS transporter, ACS family, D-galactonate transporter
MYNQIQNPNPLSKSIAKVSSTRWVISGLMFLGILINYLDRVNISHTILLMSQDIGLTPTEQGLILSAFSWGYVLFMLPGGWLVDRVGPRVINALSCATWSVFTALTGLGNTFASLLFFRVLLGAAEAPIFPGNAKVVCTWFPIQERGRATAIFDVGSYVGGALAAPFVVFVMLAWGWRAAFYACSVVGVIWSLVWYYYYRSPDEHRRVLPGELKHIRGAERDPKTGSAHPRFNWFSLLSNRKILGMSFGFFCYNYLKNFYLTWFPSYLVAERGFTIIKVGIVSLIPPACAVLAELFAGSVTDKLIARGVSVTIARKIPLCVGLMLSSVVVGAAYAKSQTLVIVLLSLSYASLIAASASIWAIPGDIAPSKDLVGSIGGIQNTFSNIAGILAPIITGVLYSTTGSFVLPLIISGALTLLGALSYWFVVGELKPLPTQQAGNSA